MALFFKKQSVWERVKSLSLDKILSGAVLFFLALLVITIFFQKIELSASDLGRHLENGRLVWSEPSLLYENFYSYTEPEHKFTNHHWLSGVIFYGLYLVGGFKLLSLFNIFLALAVFFIFFRLARRRSNFLLAALLSLPAIFLLSERVEVRPEMFSYLFFGLTWLVMENESWSKRQKAIRLVPIFILWANIHIYFFFGLVLVACYVFSESLFEIRRRRLFDWISLPSFNVFFRRAWPAVRPGATLLLIVAAASLVNPNHIRGLLYPLTIFTNYGYEIAENKSIFFLSQVMLNYNFQFFKLMLALLIASLIGNWILGKKLAWTDFLLAIFVSALALFASRNLAFFGLVSLVIISGQAIYPLSLFGELLKVKLPDSYLLKVEKINLSLLAKSALIFLSGVLLIYLLFDYSGRHLLLKGEHGLGLYTGSQDAFAYFQQADLKGPIFNNYDAGSALIFGLAGQEKVFVDNRPEAYSVDFFQKHYIPMQMDGARWQELLLEYKFKTIFFSHTDSTPWGRVFIARLLQDKDWALVYFDAYYVILVNKQEYSEEFLEEHKIDQHAFTTNLRSLSSRSSLRAKLSLAGLAQAADRPELAEEIYRRELMRQPDNVRALLSLAYLYAASDNAAEIRQAISYLQRVVEIESKVPGAYSQLGLSYWRLGNYQQAEEAWTKAIKKNRNDKTARDYLEQIADLKKQGNLPR